MTAAAAQLRAIREMGRVPTTERYTMLSTIRQPTLIVHGIKDIVVHAANAVVIERTFVMLDFDAFPDASHAVQSQHAEVFLANARLFENELTLRYSAIS